MLQKVVIIDDEAPARQLLREYLSDFTELVIVGEANNGVDAVRMIQDLRPEIVFLDVQMPGLSGLQVVAELDELPLIIFSTAYDQYALEAFDLHAVDYLLKPYTRERFRQAVHRLAGRLQQPQEAVRQLAQQLADAKGGRFPSKILVPKGNRIVALNVSDILRIGAEGDYSRLFTTNDAYLSQYGIGQLEEKLPPADFLRVHRSAIINLNYIREIFREGHTYDIRLTNGDLVRVSRGYAGRVRELMF